MNENIKNLIEETVKTSLVEHSSSFINIKMNDETMVSIPVEFCEKFAELVVKECIKVIDPTDDLCSIAEEVHRYQCVNMIKEHFGEK